MTYVTDVGEDMNQTTTQYSNADFRSGLGVFERACLLECL